MTSILLPKQRLLPAGHHIRHQSVILAGIIISFFVIFLAVTVANSRSSFFGRAASNPSAAGNPGSISQENSYLFASPVSAFADGSSIIRVTAIILSDTGMGIAGQKINLQITPAGLTITKVAEVTDTLGRAMFDVTGSSPGNYTISAEAQGVALSQTVSIAFR